MSRSAWLSTHSHNQPHCQRCRYDLRGSASATRCPECGWAIDWELAYRPKPRFLFPRNVVALLVLATALVIILQVIWLPGERVLLALQGTRKRVTMVQFARTAWILMAALQVIQLLSTINLIPLFWVQNRFLLRMGPPLAVFGSCCAAAGLLFRSNHMQRHPVFLDSLLTGLSVCAYVLARSRFTEQLTLAGSGNERSFRYSDACLFSAFWALEVVCLICFNLIAFVYGSAAEGILLNDTWDLSQNGMFRHVSPLEWWSVLGCEFIFGLALLNGVVILGYLLVRRLLRKSPTLPLKWIVRIAITLAVGVAPAMLTKTL